MGAGSFGDVKPCAEGLSESRIHYGAGYRIYFIQHEKTVIVGTKKTQSRFTFKMEINRRGMVKVRFLTRSVKSWTAPMNGLAG